MLSKEPTGPKGSRETLNELMQHVDGRLSSRASSPVKPEKNIEIEKPTIQTQQTEPSLESDSNKLQIWNSIKGFASRNWNNWSKLCDKIPLPWSPVAKFGLPVVTATVGAVWFQTFLQLGIATTQLFGGLLQPILGTAAFLSPALLIDPAIKLCQKLFKTDPLQNWQKNLISWPVKALSFVSAGIWVNTLDLSPITYLAFALGTVGCAAVASKMFGKANRAVLTTAIAALALPWTHLLTIRSFDVTIKSASPDPEVGAWNVATDLTVWNHWKKVALLAKEPAPSGGVGMVLLNKDVPLLIPSHRNANVFNAEFQGLTGKKVRVTTIGTWMKPFSAHSQPIIINYKVLE